MTAKPIPIPAPVPKPITPIPHCIDCRFSVGLVNQQRQGECRQQSPHMPTAAGKRWPPVSWNDSCGQFIKKV